MQDPIISDTMKFIEQEKALPIGASLSNLQLPSADTLKGLLSSNADSLRELSEIFQTQLQQVGIQQSQALYIVSSVFNTFDKTTHDILMALK
jgi:hypothetical protein